MYICSLPNPGEPGHIKELISDDDDEIRSFVAAEDRPGRGVYYCPNTLVAGARRRCLENIGQIDRVYSDLDFKDIVESPDEVEGTLSRLPAPPSLVRNSGAGRHVFFELKEPITRDDPDYERAVALYKRLAHVLTADLAPAHPAALLRYPGTHNTKRAEPALCQDVWSSGARYDLADIEAMLDLLQDAPLFTRREKPASNGHDRSGEAAPSDRVDVDARLSAMCFQGPGDNAVHVTQLACTASLLRCGCVIDHVVEAVLSATRKVAAADPRCAGWDWQREELDLYGMAYSFVNKNPEGTSNNDAS